MAKAPTVCADPWLGLCEAWEAGQTASAREHVVVVLPSLSVHPTLLEHLGPRVSVCEQRQLLTLLMLGRVPGARMVFVTALAPSAAELDYYAALAAPAAPQEVLGRLSVVVVPGDASRPLAAKLMEHPEAVARIRDLVAEAPGYIEAWNVTACEAEVAQAIGLPVLGAGPEHWPTGGKSAGRRLFRRLGVPLPPGREGVHGRGELMVALGDLLEESPRARGVVIKHDSTCSGDGNVVVRVVDDEGAPLTRRALEDRLDDIPRWFWDDLSRGGVVEECLAAPEVTSPSVQLEITPHGEVRVVATHDQVLDASGMTYQGCRFPADQGYAGELARHGRRAGEALAGQGVRGRLAVDFVAVPRPGRPVLGRRATWDLFALEINLRKGGTTHPRDTLAHLVDGDYDPALGRYRTANGTHRCYHASDNVLLPSLRGQAAHEVIDTVLGSGLGFRHDTGTGVVLHMLAGLAVDGRIGLTAIGRDAAQADRLAAAAHRTLARMG